MSPCEQCRRELAEYVADGEPALACYQALCPHLQVCSACRAYALRLGLVEDALCTYPPVSFVPEMTPLVMRCISAQDRQSDEEWHPLPWDVSVPALAILLALALVMVSTPPQASLAIPVWAPGSTFFELPGFVGDWVTSARALMSRDIFWAVWSGVFAATAGVGIGLSLANWNTLNRECLARLEDHIADLAAWLRNRVPRVG